MQSQTLAPKALAVLTYLAKNKGEVVSNETLLDNVWPHTIVSPNTLHRCIAQLRKALGDDGKVQVYIKTHAKQGYSLECDVRWLGITDTSGTNESEEKVVTPRSKLRLGAIAAGILTLGITFTLVAYQHIASDQSSTLTFNSLRKLTATDDKEFDATYTPDGNYIVFHRYLDKQCVNKLWAKNISTQREIQLTQDWGAYGRHSFSSDGKKLVFLAAEPCNQPATQKNCFDLVSLDFEKALENPQQPSLILKCKTSQVKKPIWLNNGDIVLMQQQSNRWKLINYSISHNSSTDLYYLEEGSLIDFAYSNLDDLIAVTRAHTDDKQYIDMLKPDGRILSSHPIDLPQEIPKFRPLYPNFDPLNKQLIFSTGKQLFTLSYQGKVAKIKSPFSDRMTQPEFHPSGKKLLMLKEPYDSDVVVIPLNNFDGTQTAQPQAYRSFERTNVGEDHAIFQPGGDLIAFWSERSGEEQLWISDGKDPQQLTKFPLDTYIRGIDWAADGKSLLVNADGALTQVFLDSSQKSIPLEHPVIYLYQWHSESNSALLALRIKGVEKVVEYNLTNAGFREVSDKTIVWVQKSQDGRLIFKDHLDQFWQPGAVEPQRIESLDRQGGRTKSFLLKENVIYAVNTENQLWSYDLENGVFKIIGEVNKDVDNLTDINHSQLLMTIQVAAKNEVVELSLSE